MASFGVTSVRAVVSASGRVWRKPRANAGWLRWAACLAVLIIGTGPVWSQAPAPADGNAAATADADRRSDEQMRQAQAIGNIIACLANGEEAVLTEQAPPQCKKFGEGGTWLSKTLNYSPFGIDSATICKDATTPDWRRLPGDTIKLIAQRAARIDSTGIRILGAVYCDAIDLVGLELPYSLVLDHSFFKEVINGRSFRTRGDLSLDNSWVAGDFFVGRAHIDGTIFASGVLFGKKLRILDTEVKGSALFRGSAFLDLAAFDTVQLSGELSVRGALFPYLLVQFSKVSGVLDLSYSQAGCAYRLRKSDVGDLVAVDAGFGEAGPMQSTGKLAVATYKWSQRDPNLNEDAFRLLQAAKGSTDAGMCNHSSISFLPGAFLISDTRVRSSLCLRSFHWLGGASTAKSYLTLNDVQAGKAASIDLSRFGVKVSAADRARHKLEMMGFETGSLFINFRRADERPYALSLSGLKFDHVYSADVACDYDPNFTAADSAAATSRPNLANDADPAASSRLPNVAEVMEWLSGNSLATTQPFTTFVDVFQKHGEDDDTKAMKIAKVDAELCLRARKLIKPVGEWFCGSKSLEPDSAGEATTAAGEATPAAGGNSGRGFFAWIGEFILLALAGVLRLIADNGYRPEKVGWFVVGAMVLFGAYFWLWLRAVALKPEKKEVLLPMGIVFMFDRLLPAYQIRADHYNVDQFYKRVPKAKQAEVPPDQRREINYFGLKLVVIPMNEAERRKIDRTLDILKVVGLVLAVFFVAAINAIVSR